LCCRANEPALSDSDQEELEVERADRSLFVQDLIISSLGSISLSTEPKHQGLMDELFSLQDSEEGAMGGVDNASHNTQDRMSKLNTEATNEDIEVITLETQNDKDS